jgi:hypothetical protein
MKRPLTFILAVLLLMTCSGCFWGWDRCHRGHDDYNRGGMVTKIAKAMAVMDMTTMDTMTTVIKAMTDQ